MTLAGRPLDGNLVSWKPEEGGIEIALSRAGKPLKNLIVTQSDQQLQISIDRSPAK